MRTSKTQKITLCALFAALTAVLSQIVIPIGPVPINMATLAVFCAGGLLGARHGALSLVIWAILGVVGVPVFTLFRSGPETLAGPTGGFIVGYIPAAFIIGLITERLNKGNRIRTYVTAMLLGMLTYFLLGTAWFMYLTNAELRSTLMICVVPFLPGDFLKIAVATVLVRRLRPMV